MNTNEQMARDALKGVLAVMAVKWAIIIITTKSLKRLADKAPPP